MQLYPVTGSQVHVLEGRRLNFAVFASLARFALLVCIVGMHLLRMVCHIQTQATAPGGLAYYHNKRTDESTWTKPAALVTAMARVGMLSCTGLRLRSKTSSSGMHACAQEWSTMYLRGVKWGCVKPNCTCVVQARVFSFSCVGLQNCTHMAPGPLHVSGRMHHPVQPEVPDQGSGGVTCSSCWRKFAASKSRKRK